MRAPARTLAVLGAAALLAACGSGGEVGRDTPAVTIQPSGSVVATVPPAIAPPGTSLPEPEAVTSLDGVRPTLRRLGDARSPVALTPRPGFDDLYLAEQTGAVKRLRVEKQRDPDRRVLDARYELEPRPILDLTGSIASGGERGLLALAFSPDGTRLYVDYTARDGAVTVDEYRMEGQSIDVRSKRTILTVAHPRANHNGGQLAFGPDGFLYVSIGDGGGQGDPDRNGQNPGTLLGTVLRIDPLNPSGDKPYGIPRGNPFADGGGAPEVWVYGLRNPWRYSFDRRTGDLWIGDVGGSQREEIDFLAATDAGAGPGANLGWSEMEGNGSHRGGTPPEGYVPPLFDYERSGDLCSVVGGYVYRGERVPDWNGVYFYTDYCGGELHVLLRTPDGRIEDRGTGITAPQAETGGRITSFGEDLDGDLYVLGAAGTVYLLEQAG